MKLKLTLDNRGNPDFRQDHSRRVPGTRARTVAVDGFEAASKACRAYIEENDLGGGNWTGGQLVDEAGTVVGQVAYNGTVWGPAGYRVGDEPVWPPATKAKAAANPFEFLTSRIKVPGYGAVTVSGCARVSHVRSASKGFSVDGQRYEFHAYMDLKDWAISGVREFRLLRDGDIDSPVPCPQPVRKAVLAALREWGKTPEARMLFMENEARDKRQDVETATRRIGYARDELSEREAELRKAQEAVARIEETIAEEAPAAPAP